MNIGQLLQAKLAKDVYQNDTAGQNTAINDRRQLEAEMMKNQAAQMNAAMYNNMVNGALTQGLGAGIYQPVKQDIPEFDPNTAPAYQCTLEALTDLWRAKHGDMWVRSGRIEKIYNPEARDPDEEFWDCAAERLRSADRLESHRGWLRLKD